MPEGDPVPLDGSLPASAAHGAEDRGLSLYVHVPYCTVRCGYCDFNTYTSTNLGPGADRADYRESLAREIALSTRVFAEAGLPARPVSTVFFGGGTPTLLPAEVLVGVLSDLRAAHPFAPDVEVTTEANPDTLTPAYLATLAAGGFTRISMGMQSAVPHVLATLDRTHDPEKIPEVVSWVKATGMQVSLDLIYGTPGESLDDWRTSLDMALAQEPDHLSAYSLIVEPGTKMGAQVKRGELPMPAEDDLADKYEVLDAYAGAAGLEWYEVSNFSRSADTRCRHNMAYWQDADWWGFGPGSHSHVGNVRFWNTKHPKAWADRLAAGHSPGLGREILDAETREFERIMLGARIKRGLRLDSLPADASGFLDECRVTGLIDEDEAAAGFLTPTLRGRLLADHLVKRLTDYL